MAGPGRTPKDALSRPNDQARRDAATQKVASDGQLRGPELPEGFEWPQRTVLWWNGLRSSPLARLWIDADWETLLDTALLHRKLWNGDLTVAGELRLRMGQFGTNPESRLRLRISVDAEAEAAKKRVVKIDDARRARLSKRAGVGA